MTLLRRRPRSLPRRSRGSPAGHVADTGDAEVDRDQRGEAPAEETDVGCEPESRADCRYEREGDYDLPRRVEHRHLLFVDFVDSPKVGGGTPCVVGGRVDLRVGRTADLAVVEMHRPGDVFRPGLSYVPVMTAIRTLVRVLRGHPFASDAALALGLAAFVLFDVLSNGDYLTGPKSVYVPAALLMTLPLAWRRRAPLLVVGMVMAALVA